MERISFLGDLMCEKYFLKAARSNGGHDFSSLFAECGALFTGSSHIVGNLETPCDDSAPYSKDLYIFNAPESFPKAARAAGIDFMTTATNHCLDRGVRGLSNTVKTLDRLGIQHTGTFAEKGGRPFSVLELSDGSRVAILSYTYGTNFADNRVELPADKAWMVNLLSPQSYGGGGGSSMRARLTRLVPKSFRIKVNKLIGRQYNKAYTDALREADKAPETAARIKADVEAAKRAADLVVVCPHMGGQFNTEKGPYVEYFTSLFEEAGADIMVANHPHVVQKFEERPSGMKAAYCLGNVSISLNSPYILKQDLPEYSIMLHVYVEAGAVRRLTFSVLKEVEDKKGYIRLTPVTKLAPSEVAADLAVILERFTGKKPGAQGIEIKEEYEL